MARSIARLCYPNRVFGTGAVLSVSSEQPGNPRAWLTDEDRGLRWRSKLGWNIRADNCKIDFNRGGVLVATIATGNYPTAALMAAAIVTALEAADAAPVWACTYNAATHIFTISADVAFTLLWGSGANKASSVALDLGYTEDDQASVANACIGDGASYKSREWVKVNAGSAVAAACGIVTDHNLGSSGTITLQGHTADLWTAPDVSQALSGDATIRIAFFASQSKQWWRLLVNDVATNTNGYTEIGIWWASPAVEPTTTYSQGYQKTRATLSTAAFSISGALKRDSRGMRRSWALTFTQVDATDLGLLSAWGDAVDAFQATFLALDAVTTPTNTVYGFFTQQPTEANVVGEYTDVSLAIAETLSGT